jgi:hypothetical protein
MKALTDPKHASWYSSISGLIPKPTADELKQKKNEGTLDQRLSVLESMWFPNEDKLALPAQTNALGRVIHKYGTKFEASSEYENFSRYARTLGATLAKAAGDSGNIAMAEQAAQLQALADADLTPQEAELAFKNIREGLGIPKTDNYYNGLRKKNPSSLSDVMSKYPADAPVTPIDHRNLLQRVLNTGKEKVDVPLPNLPYGAAGMTVGGGFGKNPIVGGAIAGVGNWLDQLKSGGIPLTREAANKYSGPAAGVATLKGAGLNAILHPIRTLGAARDAFLTRAINMGGKLPSSSIIPEAGVKYASGGVGNAGPQDIPTARTLAGQDIQTFGGANARPLSLGDLLTEISSRGRAAFGPTQDLLGKSSASYNAATRSALTDVISRISPAAGGLEKGLGKVYQAKSALGGIIGRLWPWAAITGAGAVGLSRYKK